jgi:hypothetical protein
MQLAEHRIRKAQDGGQLVHQVLDGPFEAIVYHGGEDAQQHCTEET